MHVQKTTLSSRHMLLYACRHTSAMAAMAEAEKQVLSRARPWKLWHACIVL